MLHDDGCLLVDDRAVESSREAQVFQRLSNRIGTLCAVHRIRSRMMGGQKAQLMIYIGERGVYYLRGHEVGEYFLGPDIVEPIHRYQITEPHMRRLVSYERRASQHLVLSCGLIQ